MLANSKMSSGYLKETKMLKERGLIDSERLEEQAWETRENPAPKEARP